MDPNKMTLSEIIAAFRARTVRFKLKDGTNRTIFVEEIENEDVWISDVVSAKEL